MYANRLRELLKDEETLAAPGVFDGLTGRIVEDIGYDAVYLGGYATGSATSHTEPIIDMSEMCARAREITEYADIPLIVDGDAGFGNAPHTYRAVNAYAKAGISGMHIEDQVYPKRLHYHAGRNHITDVDEMIYKIEAAMESKEDHDEDIVIIARSDAGRGQRRDELGETIEEAVERVNQYIDAGADAGMVFPHSMEELEYAADHIEGPMVFTFVEGKEDLSPTIDEMNEIGVGLSIWALSSTVVGAQAVSNIYNNLYEDGHTDIDPDMYNATREKVEEWIGLPGYYGLEEKEGKK